MHVGHSRRLLLSLLGQTHPIAVVLVGLIAPVELEQGLGGHELDAGVVRVLQDHQGFMDRGGSCRVGHMPPFSSRTRRQPHRPHIGDGHGGLERVQIGRWQKPFGLGWHLSHAKASTRVRRLGLHGRELLGRVGQLFAELDIGLVASLDLAPQHRLAFLVGCQFFS